ncbi:hypothetical protein Dimus_018873 [Dionaea muscipula]
MTNIIQSSSTRRIQYSILRAALASILLLGAARLLFDELKNDDESFLWRFWWQQGSGLNERISTGTADKDFEDEEDIEDCNVFEGKWVWDNVSHPLYTEESCPFLVKQVTCQRNGRPDPYYQFWRWQPNECNLPRFNARKLLEMLRNKRMMFVGDSIQRTQFDSMVCLLQSSIPNGKKSLQKVPSKKIFHAQDYNASIEFYWAPFIVESNSDHSTNHTVVKRSITHPDDVREYNVTTAYKMALQTWANWLESSINSQKQKVFFMTLSPTHLWSWEWNPGSDGNCFGEFYPIKVPYWGVGTSIDISRIVQDTLRELKVTYVNVLNITQLSDLRKDAHTSVYTERKGKLLTKEQRADPTNFADCIHWCLPGLPDTWNEILYAHLIQEAWI